MSTTYTSTIEVNVWKEHTCVGCGTAYRYLFKRTKTGQGGTPDAASQAAHNSVVKALEKETDMQPCPGCGLYQPDMIAAQRSRRHWWVFWSVLPFLLLWLILVLTDVMSFSTTSWVLAFTGLVYAACHVVIDLINPNSNLDGNHALAERRVEKGDLWVPKDRKPEPVDGMPIGSGVGLGHLVCYLMLAAAVLGYLAPVGLCLVAGMHTNPGWHPEVIGPGGESYVYFKDKVTSIKSMWQGQAKVTVLNWNELGMAGPPQLTATTKSDSWGNTIRVGSKETKRGTSTLWARVKMPADANLVGKTLKLNIDLTVRYPEAQGDKSWLPKENSFRHTTELRISGADSGSAYRGMWWLSFVGGLVLLCLSGILLAVFSDGFRKKALPTSIFVPEDENEEEEDEEERPRRRAELPPVPLAGDEPDEGRYRLDDRERNRDEDRYRR